jgi:pyruvate,water dikinase
MVKEQANKGKISADIIGSKGLFLQDMFEAGILLPSGFILTTAFREFMEKSGIYAKIRTVMSSSAVSLSDMNSILHASNEIIKFITEVKFPEDLKKNILEEFSRVNSKYAALRFSFIVDIRSSLSLAREFPVFLNISEENLIDTIVKMWTLSYAPAAISYRLEKGEDIKNPLAVILVQEMIAADVSGVCFTAHPITSDLGQIVIEANFGLSQELKPKTIVKDTYIVEKETLDILGKTVLSQKTMLARVGTNTSEIEVGGALQDKQKLSDSQILELVKIVKKIDSVYKGNPQKVEWVLKGSNFYIMDSQSIKEA